MEQSGSGRLSVQGLSEFVSATTRRLRGVRDHQLSYYDAQVWATARLNQVPVIFSEDFNSNAPLEGVRFVNPFASDFVLENWG